MAHIKKLQPTYHVVLHQDLSEGFLNQTYIERRLQDQLNMQDILDLTCNMGHLLQVPIYPKDNLF
jgi:hypothetical protein